ncbi:hypothetical protein K438DRAFT_1962660 [Mycena galopus ATCC 62051]|nr:hypothetical protein K438DRAFT_1962660 [Mycena galopus ATCC 62051]
MRFSVVLAPLFAAFAAAANLPRTISTNHGTLTAPATGTVVTSGQSFSFNYEDSNWCEGGYTPITVWLLDYAPTTANLNATGQFSDATFYFGKYFIGNFGLGPIAGDPVPPSTLTMPDVSAYAIGSTMYVAVVETANTCPPGNQPAQYGMTANSMITA